MNTIYAFSLFSSWDNIPLIRLGIPIMLAAKKFMQSAIACKLLQPWRVVNISQLIPAN